MEKMKFVIITGLSGAGRTQAVRALEDLGFFCVDNLPPTLIPKFAELCAQSEGKIAKIALVIDIRGGQFFGDLFAALEHLEETGFVFQILFLEAADETLVRRFKETRRRHPLAPQGRLLEGITAERKRLEELRGRAHRIIDTSRLTPNQLRDEVMSLFAADAEIDRMGITLVSFGFKYGLPLDADLVLDVRFLPNPHYVESLRPLPGTEAAVREYVTKWPITGRFIEKSFGLLDFLLPNYLSEGKTTLTVAVGCTGGKHRSVVIAEKLAEMLRKKGYEAAAVHRDAAKSGAEAGE
ncbi:MAG: RNase adapter RapZ [bacterium]